MNAVLRGETVCGGRIYVTGNFKLEVNESGRWKLNLKRSETTES